MKKTPLFIIFIISFIFLVYFALPKDREAFDLQKLAEACRQHNGKWVALHRECESSDKDWCIGAGGQFDECASACRHNPDPNAPCTLQCVPVCMFDKQTEQDISGSNPNNTTYYIEGSQVTLKDGYAEKEIAPGSATKIKTSIFAQAPAGDLNGDGINDVAVILVQDPGGSGTFYYVAAVINTGSGHHGTNAVFIGDRIAPQTTEIQDGQIIVNYADRFPWDSFSARPSIAKSKYLTYDGELKEIPRETLSQEIAKNLVSENWGDCSPTKCVLFSVNVLDGKDGVWYAEAIYDGLYDDSVRAEKRIASVHYVSGEWKFGAELSRQYKCQENRGQQDFSSELCI